MFRLTIEFQSERKLFCLPPLGQVVELGTGLFKFTVEANLKKKMETQCPDLLQLSPSYFMAQHPTGENN